MVPTRPSRSRIRIAKEIGGLGITISARRHWGIILFLGVWLCGWAMGETFALKTLLTGHFHDDGVGGPIFLSVWLTIWTVGGIAAWYLWLWCLTGEESIVIGRDAMSLRRTVLGMGRTRLVRMRALRGVRAIAGATSGFDGGRVVVETDGAPVKFGVDLTESEAEYLLGAILSEVDLPEATPTDLFHPAAIPA
jgi:hypothetical protein